MKLDMTLFDNRHSILFNVSKVVSNITISTFIRDQPGKCTFDIKKIDDLAFWEGATVSITVDSIPMFKGFVFSKKRSKDTNSISVTCFDQLRYLKNKDTFIFEGVTSGQIFSTICDKFVLKYKVVEDSGYICAPRTNDNKSLNDAIQHALDDTLINTNKWYIIRDNFGVLEHTNIVRLNSGAVIGDYNSLMNFDYTTSIDKDVYNQIKLYRDNKETGKRDIFIVNDTASKINPGKNLKEWGILQLYESVPEELDLRAIEERAMGMLSLYNNVNRDLKLESIGFPNIQAGSIITSIIEDLGDMGLNNYLLVNECTHKLSNEVHTMTLKVEVVI